MPDARREGMTEWTPDQPLRADATRQQVIDRMSHLHREAKSIGDATAPFYAVAMVDEVQKALRTALAEKTAECERLRCDAQGFHDIILRQELTIRELREDKKRLDWLEAQGNGDPWVARESTTGRGWRLANSHATPNYTTAREALDAARRDSGEGEE